MTETAKATQYQAFIQWLECDCGLKRHGIVRVFQLPFRNFLEDGTPAKKYRFLCHFDLQGDTIKMQGTMKGPSHESRNACLILARDLGATHLIWQREKNGKLLTRKFRIPQKST